MEFKPPHLRSCRNHQNVSWKNQETPPLLARHQKRRKGDILLPPHHLPLPHLQTVAKIPAQIEIQIRSRGPQIQAEKGDQIKSRESKTKARKVKELTKIKNKNKFFKIKTKKEKFKWKMGDTYSKELEILC